MATINLSEEFPEGNRTGTPNPKLTGNVISNVIREIGRHEGISDSPSITECKSRLALPQTLIFNAASIQKIEL